MRPRAYHRLVDQAHLPEDRREQPKGRLRLVGEACGVSLVVAPELEQGRLHQQGRSSRGFTSGPFMTKLSS